MSSHLLKKIIIADDEEDILEIIRYSLEDIPNADIRSCNSGREVIQEALTFHPDLILLDFMMPNMDGEATMRALRSIPSTANIPIIFLTAKVQKEEVKDYLKMGAEDVISKPFDPMTLAHTVLGCWQKILAKQNLQ